MTRDLVRGLKKPRKGRRGLTARQVLRSLVLMRVKNWDYRELRERIADGLTLRQFTDFYCDPVPKHDAFNRGFNRLTPQTLKAINDMVVQAAVALDLEDGAKLRVDTTVVETDIHHPTDSRTIASACHKCELNVSPHTASNPWLQLRRAHADLAEKGARMPGKFTPTAIKLCPVHRHN